MKCWTVQEEAVRGIKIEKSEEGEPIFRVDKNSFIPVSSDIKELFEERAAAILLIRSVLREDDQEALQTAARMVTGQDLINPAAAAEAWASENPDEMWLKSADISDNEPTRIIQERKRQRSDLALVHVCTTAPATGGQLWLEANTFEEELVENRRPYVIRRYHDFPAVGIGPVIEGKGPKGEPQGLYVMYPRSSFRINRDTPPPTLVVAWPGSTLKCFAPAKYRREKDERAA